jgi:hypothetical protein
MQVFTKRAVYKPERVIAVYAERLGIASFTCSMPFVNWISAFACSSAAIFSARKLIAFAILIILSM